MPYEDSLSPVTPRTGSRLWTVGASAGIAILALIGAAALEPDNALWLLGAAALVGVSAWTLNRTPASAAGPAPALETPAPDTDAALLESVFEALADPVLVVSGGEADDIAGRRIVLANTAARDLLRIQREGGLLVPVLRDPRPTCAAWS
jgi:two-component system phosphate regulon sensor histidine kinase PhoR